MRLKLLALASLMMALYSMEAQANKVPLTIQYQCESRGAFIGMMNSLVIGGEQLPFSMRKCIDTETVAKTQLAMLHGSHSDLIDLCVRHQTDSKEDFLVNWIIGLRATEETATKIHGSWMYKKPSYQSVKECVSERIDKYD